MIFDLILIIVLGICLATDLRFQRIYNKIIFPSLIIAVALHAILYGYVGLKASILGFVVGLGILLIPYLLGGIGAGDVKLLGLIGALKGIAFVINTALYMAVIGGIIALVIIIYHSALLKVFREIGVWVYSLLCGIKYRLEFPTSVFVKRYPYGAAIVGGALVCLIFKEAWII